VLDADNCRVGQSFLFAAGIDPQVEAVVQEGIIELRVTETALSANVVPTVAQGAVYSASLRGKLTSRRSLVVLPQTLRPKSIADDAATDFVASAEGTSNHRGFGRGSSIAELQIISLPGIPANDGHTELEPLYMPTMDQELATNTELQAGIAQGITDLTTAYEAGALPPEHIRLLWRVPLASKPPRKLRS
jgi:hypothetical protein